MCVGRAAVFLIRLLAEAVIPDHFLRDVFKRQIELSFIMPAYIAHCTNETWSPVMVILV